MFSNYSSFIVEIKNIKFITDESVVIQKTAIITFHDLEKKKSSMELLGYIDTEEIYKLIDKKKPINLNHCYVSNFSLSNYRNLRNLGKKEYLKLFGFSARNAFFDSKFPVDFSFAEFDDGDIDFENTQFANGNVSFNSAKFGNGNVNFAYVLFNDGNLDFSNAHFGEGDLIFKNSIFKPGIKDFQYTDFGLGEISFINTEFNDGDISFINANFNDGDVSFKVARFGKGKIDFHYAKFGKGDISFERTEFGEGRVDFRKVEFGQGKVNFNRSIFGNGDVYFEASELKKGRFSFKRTEFGNGNINFELAEYVNVDLSFDRATLGKGSISFYNSKFHTLSLKSCHLDNYLDLRLAKCTYVDLSDTIARDIIDLKPHEFDVDIDIVNFSGMRLIGRIYIDWKVNDVKKLISKQTNTNKRDKAEQFRILKENFNVTGQYSDEDKSYVEFKRYEAKSNLNEAIKKKPYSAIWEYPWYIFKQLLFDKAGLYATSPLRVIISMLILYVFFSIIYIIILHINSTGIVSGYGGEHAALSIISKSFYHSAITFLTIGYGDFYPLGIIRWISSIEGFSGLFLMAYFTVAFVRKILR